MAKVISVVSGKGGAGKSLLTAVLGNAIAREGEKVVLVDLDIFVRGLTILMYGHQRPRKSGKRATMSDLLGVFGSGSASRGPKLTGDGLFLERFFYCDILPAVDNIATPLDYDDQNLSDYKFCKKVIADLLSALAPEYDYIILDNRAGMDSLFLSSCELSDVILAVAEDDEIGRQTNVNLVKYIQQRTKGRVVYTLINKGRGISSYADVENRFRNRPEYSVLGVVPFDLEVMNSFGEESFWSGVNSTLYFRAIIDAWSRLAHAEELTEISKEKYNFPPKLFMRSSDGRFTLFERFLKMYGILFVFAGLGLFGYNYLKGGGYTLEEILPLVSLFAGVTFLVLSTSAFQSALRGKKLDRFDEL